MNAGQPERQPFRFTNPRYSAIYERLGRLVGPGTAAFFVDACVFMDSTPPPRTATHLVAHALREIESALRDVLEPYIPSPIEPGGSKQKRSATDAHRDEITAILAALGIAADDPVAIAWLRLPGSEAEYALSSRAHRRDLAAPRPLDPEFRSLWEDMVSILDVVLDRFEARYLELLPTMDRLLAIEHPTKNDASQIRLHIPNNLVSRRYFFDRLNTASWLAPLEADGFFRDPPSPIVDHSEGTTSFVPWPESAYLARIAHEAPDTVARIMLDVPETPNLYVHEDLADAACQLPAELTEQWARQEANWVRGQDYLSFNLPTKLARLIVHLASGGCTDAAIQLADALLDLLPLAEDTGEPDHGLSLGYDKARSRIPSYEYDDVLRMIVPEIADAAGLAALEFTSRLLDEILVHSGYRREGGEWHDYSFVWRPAIEDRGRRRGLEDLRDFAISAVRDVSSSILSRSPHEAPAILNILGEYPWTVFQRLALHLLRDSAVDSPALVVDWIERHQPWTKPSLDREYALLLRDRFESLPDDARQAFFARVTAGPDIAVFEARVLEREGRAASDNERRDYIDEWQWRQLSPVREFLSPPWDERYQELVTLLGEPADPEHVPEISASWVGPTSPVAMGDFNAMSVEQVAEFLTSWRPTGAWGDPTPEGLGRVLSEAIAQAPQRFSSSARAFTGLEPTYVRALISGLDSAVKDGKEIVWQPVLELGLWVLRQMDDATPYNPNNWDRDHGWGWTRKAFAEILQDGLSERQNGIPFELRELVWVALGGRVTGRTL